MNERPRAARRVLRAVLGLAGVIALILLAVFARSEQRLGRLHAKAPLPEMPAFEVDAPLLERGRHLVTVVAQCTHCHGPDLAGREMADDPFIGRLHAANLTRGQGGIAARYRDADWIAALRQGIAPDGRSLLLMPSAGLSRLSDRDLAAIVAYVRQVPAVDRELPPKRTGWLTRAVVAAGLAPDLISAEQVAANAQEASARPPDERATRGGTVEVAWQSQEKAREFDSELDVQAASASAAYGAYLVEVGSCRVCHRADLAGGLHPLSLPGEPLPPDLTARGSLGRWTLNDFGRAMREGRTPDGRTLDRAFMPWPGFAGLDDFELESLWLYLRGLEEAGETSAKKEGDGAAKKTRTSTGLLPPAPQAGASTNSATAARGRGT